MKVFSWNARGLRSPRAFNFLLSIKQEVNHDLLFLIETKSGQARMEQFRVKLGFEGKLVVNSLGNSGGLCLFWKAGNKVELLSFSVAHIDVRLLSFGDRW